MGRTLAPVPSWRINIAKDQGMKNADINALASREVGLPFYIALAVMEQETTNGTMKWGGDKGGNFSRLPGLVTEDLYRAHVHNVVSLGYVSNGVGTYQITYAGKRLASGRREGGYFLQAEQQGIQLWTPRGNALFGQRLWVGNLRNYGSLRRAAEVYNGGPGPAGSQAKEYGQEVVNRAQRWKRLLKIG